MAQPLDGYVLSGANQEHGIVSRAGMRRTRDIAQRFPVGTQLRILPNHACATGAQFPSTRPLAPAASLQHWPRFYGW